MVDSPWARVSSPIPIPRGVTGQVLRALPDDEFARLIRDQIVPRTQDRRGRVAWESFWGLLRTDDALAERTYDVLERFLDEGDAALVEGGLDEHTAARAKKFMHQCDMAWKRIDRGREREGPLGWAGEQGQAHPSHSRRVIATLVGAIARHRSTVLATVGKPSSPDADLWDTLRYLGFDPRDFDSGNRSIGREDL